MQTCLSRSQLSPRNATTHVSAVASPAPEAACRLRDCSRGQLKRKMVFQDDAVTPPALSFPHILALFRRRERTDKSSIVCPCGPKVGAANDRLLAAKLARVFRLQRTERGLGPAFTALGRNLHRIALCEGRVRHCAGGSALVCARGGLGSMASALPD